MREIKFRAWNKERGKFNMCNVHIDGTGLLFWQFGFSCDVMDKEERENNWVIQQYTGLKDTNSKEIYEGDVCKHTSGEPEINSVEYYCGEWHLEPHGLHLSNENEVVEVIGNIYENPELLKDKKDEPKG